MAYKLISNISLASPAVVYSLLVAGASEVDDNLWQRPALALAASFVVSV